MSSHQKPAARSIPPSSRPGPHASPDLQPAASQPQPPHPPEFPAGQTLRSSLRRCTHRGLTLPRARHTRAEPPGPGLHTARIPLRAERGRRPLRQRRATPPHSPHAAPAARTHLTMVRYASVSSPDGAAVSSRVSSRGWRPGQAAGALMVPGRVPGSCGGRNPEPGLRWRPAALAAREPGLRRLSQ